MSVGKKSYKYRCLLTYSVKLTLISGMNKYAATTHRKVLWLMIIIKVLSSRLNNLQSLREIKLRMMRTFMNKRNNKSRSKSKAPKANGVRWCVCLRVMIADDLKYKL